MFFLIIQRAIFDMIPGDLLLHSKQKRYVSLHTLKNGVLTSGQSIYQGVA